MKTIRWLLLFLLAAAQTVRAAEPKIDRGDVVVIPLQGEISSALVLFVRRGVKAAESAGASSVIFEMNTYGGRLDAAEDLTTVLNHITLPTYTFINTNAGSAGAMVTMATKHIYMAPVSAIGAAAPIQASGEDLPKTAQEKTISYFSALIRGSAQRNGHNPDIAEAFMNKEKEVKIGNRVVHAKGSLLSLNAQDAIEKINGQPLLADGVADSVADLIKKANLKGEVVSIDPGGFEQLAFWVTKLAPLLLLGGIVCAYIEFKIPGFGLAGIASIICFALFFLGHYLAGLAGWEVVALFVLGLLMVLVEVFFFAHSTIVVGVVGVFLMLGSLLWAMADRYPGQKLFPIGPTFAAPLLNLLIALVGSVIIGMLLARYLPRTSFYRRFALVSSNPPGPSLTGAPREFANAVALAPGMNGIALTTLRPSGKARFDDRVVDVITGGEFVAAQTAVSVVQTDGMRVIVKAAGQ